MPMSAIALQTGCSARTLAGLAKAMRAHYARLTYEIGAFSTKGVPATGALPPVCDGMAGVVRAR